MGWQDKLQIASINGIEFFTNTKESEHGRRISLHTYPNKNIPYTEDFGRKTRVYSIRGYFVGDEYNSQMERLINEIEKKATPDNPLKFVHPNYGELNVICKNFRSSENKSNGRMISFTLDLLEIGDYDFPDENINYTFETQGDKELLIDNIKQEFISDYKIETKPLKLMENVSNNLDSAINNIQNIKKSVSSVGDFQRKIKSIISNASSIVFDAKSLSNTLTDILTFGTDLNGDGEYSLSEETSDKLLNEYLKLSEYNINSISNTDPSIKIGKLIKTSSIILSASIATVKKYNSITEAEETINIINNKINNIMIDPNLSNKTFNLLYELKTNMNKAITNQFINLSRLVNYTPNSTSTLINIVYDLYGNLNRYDDILIRNRVEHPGFIKGGESLEVEIEPE